MSSFVTLYIGKKTYSWRYEAPESFALLFTADDYRFSECLEPNTIDEQPLPLDRHTFCTSCGLARDRLQMCGVTLDLLKRLHFHYYRFDINKWRDNLENLVEAYLYERFDAPVAAKRKPAYMHHFGQSLPRMTPGEEFSHVLKSHKTIGSRAIYDAEQKERGAKLIQQMRSRKDPGKSPWVTSGQHSSLSKQTPLWTYARDSLHEFLRSDPYLPENRYDEVFDEDIWRCGINEDLWFIYSMGLHILASDPSIPIELDISEVMYDSKPVDKDFLEYWIAEAKSNLRARSDFLHAICGGLPRIESNTNIAQEIDLMREKTTKDKGPVLEAHVRRIFSEEPGFEASGGKRRGDDEIDVVVVNRIDDPFWVALQSPLLLIECRNRRAKVAAKDVRDFEVKVQNTAPLCRLGIIVSMGGFTREAMAAIRRGSRENYKILAIDRTDLKRRMEQGISTRAWLEKIITDQF